MLHSEAVIDLDALRHNVAAIDASTDAQVMAVVKADGYGHGMVPIARAALQAGATWLGVATVDEALALRDAGLTAPVLAWLWSPQDAPLLEPAVRRDIDLGASSAEQLETLLAVGEAAGAPVRLHLKIDTGLSRSGCPADRWPDLVAAAAKAQLDGRAQVVAIFSHFACADTPDHPANAAQLTAFTDALAVAARAGVEPQLRHFANSPATLTNPRAHFDLVRIGIAGYGLDPVLGGSGLPLRPVMTLQAAVAIAKQVPAGSGVSYGHRYHTSSATRLAVIPLGYGDGIPRAATNVAPVWIGGRRRTISGTVCMDQFVVDVGDAPVEAGDVAVLFGDGADGAPTAQEWADAIGTIHYELVTRIGARVPRRYLGVRS